MKPDFALQDVSLAIGHRVLAPALRVGWERPPPRADQMSRESRSAPQRIFMAADNSASAGSSALLGNKRLQLPKIPSKKICIEQVELGISLGPGRWWVSRGRSPHRHCASRLVILCSCIQIVGNSFTYRSYRSHRENHCNRSNPMVKRSKNRADYCGKVIEKIRRESYGI